jgi:hypothetical protein
VGCRSRRARWGARADGRKGERWGAFGEENRRRVFFHEIAGVMELRREGCCANSTHIVGFQMRGYDAIYAFVYQASLVHKISPP